MVSNIIRIALLCIAAFIASAQTLTVYPTTTVNARYYRSIGGSSTYYYWVQPIYPNGRGALAVSASITNAAAGFSQADYVGVTWKPMENAIGYDVLRTTSATTPSGSCACYLQQNTTSANYTDYGAALATATVPTNGANISTGVVNIAATPSTVICTLGFPTLAANGGLVTTAGVATKSWISEIFVPYNTTVTGIAWLIGSTGGTDKVTAALWDSAGNVLGNSILDSSVTVGTASTVQKIPLTAALSITGPATYYIGIATNGTTATIATPTVGMMKTLNPTGTFNTIAAITPPTVFTTNIGINGCLY